MFMPGENVVRSSVLLLLLVACSKPSGVSAAEDGSARDPLAAATMPSQVRDGERAVTQNVGSGGATPAPIAAGEVEEAQVLIWGGGRTPEEGRRALERFEAEREGLEAVLSLGEGYPRMMASDTLPGLNPSFHVVVLGVCKPVEAKEPLNTLRAFKPGVYARAVKLALGPGSCPKIENGLEEAGTERLNAKPFELTAVSFMALRPEDSAVPWLVRLYLRDEKGNLVDQADVDPRDGMWDGAAKDTCLAQAAIQGASVRVTVACERLAGGPGPKERREEFEYRIKAGKIEWVSDPF